MSGTGEGSAKPFLLRTIGERLEAIREAMARACGRAGRLPEEVELLAVTKYQPIEAVEAAHQLGLRRFGENRVQEAEAKLRSFLGVHGDVRLDMLGHLQSNKIGKALSLFSRIQSIDSVELIRSLATRHGEGEEPVELLFELHTAESSKGGFPDEDSLLAALDELHTFPSALLFKGVMTMAPLGGDDAAVRASFRRLARLGRRIEESVGVGSCPVLSMGMSADYEMAIEEGATLVRIGTALFGETSA